MNPWICGGLNCVWTLFVAVFMFLYMAWTRNRVFYGIQPDDYHSYDKEQLKEYWNTGKRWRARLRSRAILVAIPTLGLGYVIIFVAQFVKVGPVAAPVDPVAIAVTQTLAAIMTGTPVP